MSLVLPQNGTPVFYLLERVDGGGKGTSFVYIGSAPAFSQAPDFDAVVATGSTRLQTLRKLRKEVKVKALEDAVGLAHHLTIYNENNICRSVSLS